METQFGMYVILGNEKLFFCFSGTFLKKKNECERANFVYCVRFSSSFPVDSNVKHCAISYILPLITKIFSRTLRWNTVLMFYNITRAVFIAFNDKKCSNLFKSAETIL